MTSTFIKESLQRGEKKILFNPKKSISFNFNSTVITVIYGELRFETFKEKEKEFSPPPFSNLFNFNSQIIAVA